MAIPDRRNKKPTETPDNQEIIQTASIKEVPENTVDEDFDIEELEPENKEPEDEEIEGEEQEELEPGDDEEIEDDELEDEEQEDEEIEDKEPVKKKKKIDYKKRYKDSSKESIILFSKNKKLVDTIEEAKNLPEPTAEELQVYARANGAEYDELDEFSKNILKRTLVNERRFAKVDEVTQESRALDAWSNKLDSFLEEVENNNTYPTLIAHSDEFKTFALKGNHQNADLELLVAAFMHNLPKRNPKSKGSLLLTRGGSRNESDKKKLLTAEDLTHYRKTDHRKYKELIKAKKASKVVIN